MTREPVPENVKRFILTSITSVPHLEAMLLLRNESGRAWDSGQVAKRLYTNDKTVEQLLTDLCAAGVLVVSENAPLSYRYQPRSAELRDMIDQLAEVYSKNLVQVTDLIHSNTNRMAQRFADAFKWRKDE